MKGKLKKIFAGVLSVMMVLSTMPMGIFAEDADIDGMLDIDLGDIEVQEVEQSVAKTAVTDTTEYTNKGWTFMVGEEDGMHYAVLTGLSAGNATSATIPNKVTATINSVSEEMNVEEIGDGTNALKNFSNVTRVECANNYESNIKINVGAFSNFSKLTYFLLPDTILQMRKFNQIGTYTGGTSATNNVFNGCDNITFHTNSNVAATWVNWTTSNPIVEYLNNCSDLKNRMIGSDSTEIGFLGDETEVTAGGEKKWNKDTKTYTLLSNKSLTIVNGENTGSSLDGTDSIQINASGTKKDCKIEVTAGEGAVVFDGKTVTASSSAFDGATATFTVTSTDGCNIQDTFYVKIVLNIPDLNQNLFEFRPNGLNGSGSQPDAAVVNGENVARLRVVDNENIDKTEIEVPGKFKYGGKTYTTVSIANNGFSGVGCDKIKKIILPETLVGYENNNPIDPWYPIGANAFQGCKNLEYINLPSNLKADNFVQSGTSVFDSEVAMTKPLYIHFDSKVAGLESEARTIGTQIDPSGEKVVVMPSCNAVNSITGKDTLFLDLGLRKTMTVTKLVSENGYKVEFVGPVDETSQKEEGVTVIPNEEADFNAKQYDANGNETTGVIRVASNGAITALKAGNAQICVMSTDGTRVKKLVDVYVSRMTTSTAAYTTQYWSQKNKTFKAQFPKLAIPQGHTTRTYWSTVTVNGNTKSTAYATVGSTGKLTCKKKSGTVYVKARLYDLTDKKDIAQSIIKVTVKKPSFTTNKTKFTVKKGKSATITIKSSKQKPTTTAGGYKFTCKAANTKSKKYIKSIKVSTKSSKTTITVKTKKKKGTAYVYVTGLGGIKKKITIKVK